ncbi:LOW QUALITY PROTEIN: putative disease resistance protein At4g11170 [Morus notabilis]|uniref:LOW QUALITY PROTEIN: putative disease resistance protein At4g11170 n=1 Tax=Morus notabilis TaxID=981085 RepID=UPI000CED274B|nr:LOW QUALITY PROTEIN: putative disease resistance protein At4g11170 [Morus notabilis]
MPNAATSSKVAKRDSESSSSFFSTSKYFDEVFRSHLGLIRYLIMKGQEERDICRKGIRTYRDDLNLERGDEISPALSRAIEESMISIVVFSKEYASSSWCLNELLHILKCKNEEGQIVLSVFYNIDPSDIRKQKGRYAIAFAAHKKRFGPKKVEEWRNALTVAADLSGFHSQDQYETELIEKIVKDVLRKLNRLPQISIATKGLVGIDQQLEEIESLLCFGLPNPRVIGLWGLGGIGKTTLAIEIFNRFSYRFENCCFLENVRKNSEKRGLPYLEIKLFSNLLEERDLESPANSSVRNRLHNKTMLIVLDDVDNIRQLDCLLGGGSWFGPGSKVIMTTRDAQLLKKYADEIHQVKPLDFEKALELFYLNAFKTKPSITRFIELSEAIVTYTGGNPLALKILGSSLHSQAVEYWEHTWNKLKIIPHSDVQKVLKISYDGLDDKERDIFLDIAYFLKGERRDFIESILDNCGLFPRLGIEVLINKSLITIFKGKVRMHDLIQEMGWEIVRQQSIKDPGERSRLWIPHDVYNVLKNNRGTRAIEGIYLDMSMIDDDLHLKPTVFNEMHRLRLLKIYIANHSDDHKFKIYLTEGLQFLPPSLRYLCWYSYPLKSLPSNYEGEYLVELDMPCSELKQLWSGVQNLRNLKRINLDPGERSRLWIPQDVYNVLKNNRGTRAIKGIYLDMSMIDDDLHLKPTVFNEMHRLRLLKIYTANHSDDHKFKIYLTEGLQFLPPSLRYLCWYSYPLKSLPSNYEGENLVELDMPCSELKQLWSGVQNLRNLKRINLGYSKQLIKLPDLSRAPKLESINLEGCRNLVEVPPLNFQGFFGSLTLCGCIKIKSLPKISGNINYLNLDLTGIKELPLSIRRFESLVELSLRGCQHIKNLPATTFPRNIQVLNLSDLSIKQVPLSIELLENLVELSLEGCQHIKHLPAVLPRNLEILNLRNSSIEQVSSLSIEGLDCLREFYLGGCKMLENLSGNPFENIPSSIIKLHRLRILDIKNCKKLRSLPQLPSSVTHLDASGCTSLETISSSGCWKLGFNIQHVTRPFISKTFSFRNCWKLERNARSILIDFLYGVDKLNLEGRRHTIEVCYPGNEIPKWFRHQDEGISTTMKLPHGWHNSNFMGFAICIVAPLIPAGAGSNSSKCEWREEIRFDLHLKTKYGQIYKYDNNSGGDFWIYHDDEEEEAKILSSDISSDHVFMQCVTNSLFNRHPDAMEASFYFKFRVFKNGVLPQNENCDLIVKRIGVGLVYARK